MCLLCVVCYVFVVRGLLCVACGLLLLGCCCCVFNRLRSCVLLVMYPLTVSVGMCYVLSVWFTSSCLLVVSLICSLLLVILVVRCLCCVVCCLLLFV